MTNLVFKITIMHIVMLHQFNLTLIQKLQLKLRWSSGYKVQYKNPRTCWVTVF